MARHGGARRGAYMQANRLHVGLSGRGEARPGPAWCGVAWYGEVSPALLNAGAGGLRRGEACSGKARHGKAI